MKNSFKKFLCAALAMVMLLSMAACKPEPAASYDGPALLQSLLKQVQFEDALKDAGVAADLYFADLPENAKVTLYIGSGYFADAVALITVAKEADISAAKDSVQTYLAQQKNQFANYIPEEVPKTENAVVWSGGNYVIVCITKDTQSAEKILENAENPDYLLSGRPTDSTGDTTASDDPTDSTGDTKPGETTAPTDPPATTAPTNPPATTNPSVPDGTYTPTTNLFYTGQTRPDGYPLLQSLSGTYSVKNGFLIVDNAAYETCGYSDSVSSTYASLVSQAADALAGKTRVYCLAIPKSIGIMVPDDIQEKYSGVPNQEDHIEKVFAKMSANVVPVRCFDNLMRHRNEYLYFRTDHHWNGVGAYYAYEAFCETKGITPYTMAQRQEVKYEGFKGTLKDTGVEPADTVYAYKPYCTSATMKFYANGATEGTAWPIISSAKNYNCFAGSDQPLAIFKNPQVTDGSVCIIVKESFGNALLPYFVDHYSTVYEIDYRYWTGNLMEYAREVGATDMVFANNIMMISTSVLVGKLADNIQ